MLSTTFHAETTQPRRSKDHLVNQELDRRCYKRSFHAQTLNQDGTQITWSIKKVQQLMGHYADLYTKTRHMLNWHGHDSCLSRSATANSFGRGNGVTRFQKIKVCVSRTNWVYRIDDYYRKHYLNTAIHTFNLRIYLQSLIRTP